MAYDQAKHMELNRLGAYKLVSQGEVRPGYVATLRYRRLNGLEFFGDGTVMYGLSKYQSMQDLREALGDEEADAIDVGTKMWSWQGCDR